MSGGTILKNDGEGINGMFYLESSTEIQITKPVEIVYPWSRILLPMKQPNVEIGALGGTGFYEWRVEDSQMAVVHGFDNAAISTFEKVGETWVYLHDTRSLDNYARIKIIVNEIHSVELIESHAEGIAGHDPVILSMRALNKDKDSFDNCYISRKEDLDRIQIQIEDEEILQMKSIV